nr:hypothetical protein [uncultured Caulobacter sp.]
MHRTAAALTALLLAFAGPALAEPKVPPTVGTRATNGLCAT